MTKTHGMSSTRFCKIWYDFRKRCSLKSCTQYCDYGGRGICVSEEWQVFENFYNDMFSTYNDNLTLERVDVNGNYCKENCNWVTPAENAQNRENNRIIEYGDLSMTISEWARHIGISRQGLRYRLNVGYSIHDCLNKKDFYCRLKKEKVE